MCVCVCVSLSMCVCWCSCVCVHGRLGHHGLMGRGVREDCARDLCVVGAIN